MCSCDIMGRLLFFFFFSSRRRHTRSDRDWSSDVCPSDLCKAMGMKVIAWSQNLTAERCKEAGVDLAASKEELLRQSDIVSIHVVLGGRTRGLIEIGRASCRERV